MHVYRVNCPNDRPCVPFIAPCGNSYPIGWLAPKILSWKLEFGSWWFWKLGFKFPQGTSEDPSLQNDSSVTPVSNCFFSKNESMTSCKVRKRISIDVMHSPCLCFCNKREFSLGNRNFVDKRFARWSSKFCLTEKICELFFVEFCESVLVPHGMEFHEINLPS